MEQSDFMWQYWCWLHLKETNLREHLQNHQLSSGHPKVSGYYIKFKLFVLSSPILWTINHVEIVRRLFTSFGNDPMNRSYWQLDTTDCLLLLNQPVIDTTDERSIRHMSSHGCFPLWTADPIRLSCFDQKIVIFDTLIFHFYLAIWLLPWILTEFPF